MSNRHSVNPDLNLVASRLNRETIPTGWVDRIASLLVLGQPHGIKIAATALTVDAARPASLFAGPFNLGLWTENDFAIFAVLYLSPQHYT